MKAFLTTIAITCLFTLTCSAQWTAGTAPYVYLTTATNNVGIGTTAPAYQITTAGRSGLIASFGNDQAISSQVYGAFANRAYFGYNGSTNNATIQGSSAKGIEFNVNNSTFGLGLAMLINTSGYVGIGTAAPAAKLHVVGPEIRLTGTGTSGAGTSAVYTIFDSNGTTRRGYFGDASAGTPDLYLTAENDAGLYIATGGAARMYFPSTGNIGVGTVHPDQLLTVNGTMHAKSVIVDLNIVPDYVFKPAYKLPSLAYVKNYIDKHSHLPEVPSEAEIKKNGLDVGEMNATLLKKSGGTHLVPD